MTDGLENLVDKRPICMSGGADGADLVFGECAKSVGHIVTHVSFFGHHTEAPADTVATLPQALLDTADQYLHCANKTLKRTFPTDRGYINNLLRRNYFQVRETKAIYAVAPLKSGQRSQVEGGTAWAIQMGIDLRVPVIFLFDTKTNQWHQYLYSMGAWEFVLPIDIIHPRAFSVYTGIGTRHLTDEGRAAIHDLYFGGMPNTDFRFGGHSSA